MRMKVLIVAAGFLAGITAGPAAGEGIDPPDQDWSWTGPRGAFDKAQLQRGLQVYTEICAACHDLSLVAYRNLAALGYNEDEIKAYAADYEVEDGPDENGDMFMRAALPSDRFVSPFANENAARASNNGAYPPGLSLMTKARKNGANYLYAIMTGYDDDVPEVYPDDPEKEFELGDGMSYNHFFTGFQIAMPQPLFGDDVEYADGTEATLEQESKDVTAFLAWAAEPELEERKAMGIGVLLFLGLLFVAVVAVKKAVWRDVKH